jgi:hypothetical protein
MVGHWTVESIGGGDWNITWLDDKGSTVSHDHIAISGGAGAAFTFAPDGTVRADWPGSAPFYGQTEAGYRVHVNFHGYATGRMHTLPGGRFKETDGDHSHETAVGRVNDETPQPEAPTYPSGLPIPRQPGDDEGSYVCSRHQLQISYDSGQVQTFSR